jgi:hypothetical protein
MAVAICKHCGAEYNARPVNIKNGITKYCSRRCLSKAKENMYLGEKNPKWRGGKIKWSDGRSVIYAPDHPHAHLFGGTHILEYRLIAEKKIGRYLNDDEIVHHVNGDYTDNRPENLEVMSLSEHAKIHAIGRRDNETGRFLKRKVA